ncbi:MAG: hypothetical protein HGA44_10410, partial [Cellulomonadaceae bacterium]|nr:hypothetical protein [Cellulomonadaceae bacterium]
SAAAAAGDPDLAETLRSFSTSWSDARTEMLGSIGALAEACRDIGTTFAEIDAQLAAALR